MPKRILFITYENPFTRNAGDHIYTCQILESLGRLGFHVDILMYDSNGDIDVELHEYIRSVHLVSFTPKTSMAFALTWRSGSVTNRRSKDFINRARNILENGSYCSVFINHSKMSFLIPPLKKVLKSSGRKVRVVGITHNAESQLEYNTAVQNRNPLWKILRLAEAVRAYLCEKAYLEHSDVLTSICDYDKTYQKKIIRRPSHELLRPVYYNYNPDSRPWADRRTIVVCGSFTWLPKRDNLRELLGELDLTKISNSGFRLKIVGKMKPADLADFRMEFPVVEFTGGVDDVVPHVADAAFNLVPEKQGGGFKLKILEALVNGSVVLCDKCAIRDLHLLKGEGILLYSDVNELNEFLAESLKGGTKCDDILGSAKALLREFHSTEIMDKSLSEILKK